MTTNDKMETSMDINATMYNQSMAVGDDDGILTGMMKNIKGIEIQDNTIITPPIEQEIPQEIINNVDRQVAQDRELMNEIDELYNIVEKEFGNKKQIIEQEKPQQTKKSLDNIQRTTTQDNEYVSELDLDELVKTMESMEQAYKQRGVENQELLMKLEEKELSESVYKKKLYASMEKVQSYEHDDTRYQIDSDILRNIAYLENQLKKTSDPKEMKIIEDKIKRESIRHTEQRVGRPLDTYLDDYYRFGSESMNGGGTLSSYDMSKLIKDVPKKKDVTSSMIENYL